MQCTFKDITLNKTQKMEVDNCTITGNSVAYKIEDDEITRYDIKDGKIDKKSATKVEEIELTNYQISFLDILKEADNDDKSSKPDDSPASSGIPPSFIKSSSSKYPISTPLCIFS